MLSLNTRFKSAVLVLTLLTASQVCAISFSSLFTPKKIAVLTFVAMWIRLRSKGSNYDYKISDWKEDLRQVMEDYNIFDIELYQKLVELFDKYVVGRQLSLLDVSYRSKSDDNTIMTLKDKKLKCSPFGLVGLLDAYVIIQLEAIGKIGTGWDSTNKFFEKFNDSITVVGNNNNVVVNNQ
jgi:hypothetical protein